MKIKSFFRSFSILIIILFFSAISTCIYAQYKIYTWENFENNIFPTTLCMFGDANPQNVYVAPYSQCPDYQTVTYGTAKTECGSSGMFFKTSSNGRYLRIVSNNILNRDLLGETRKAIIQSDFYLTPPSPEMIGMALLAAEIDPKRTDRISAYYRLGINRFGQIYFSYIDRRIQERPLHYEKDETNAFKLKMPAWHRFQMAFQGPDKIHCFVDGKEAPFSPVTNLKLKQLRMGIMIAARPGQLGTCITDNLSIQLAEENLPMPGSPWSKKVTLTIASPFEDKTVHIPAASNSNLSWFTSVPQAVHSNASLKRAYLVLFYSPFAKSNNALNRMITSDLNAHNYLMQFCLVCIDVNQLHGGLLAQQFGIFKLPCFVILDYRGDEVSRTYFEEGQTWNSVQTQLEHKTKQ